MTQDYFDMIVVIVAQIAVYKGEKEEDIFEEMLPNLNHTYNDPLEPVEVVRAAKKIRELLKNFLSGEESSGNFTQLEFCVNKFEPNGKKRRKRFFGGTLFNYEKTPIPNLADQCIKNMACYLVNTSTGRIPIAPDGWKL